MRMATEDPMMASSSIPLHSTAPVELLEDRRSHANTSNYTQTHGSPNRSSRIPARKNTSTKSNQVCRFFTSKNGCRAGDRCRFQHVKPAHDALTTQTDIPSESTSHPDSDPTGSTSSPPGHDRPIVPISRPSIKPISQKEVENPREYQLTQVVRRYSPFRADLDDKSTLKFRLTPTDPDFPFELETGLHCVLDVPLTYPQNGKPSLRVENPEMPKGFQINVEKGFDSLIEQNPSKSLLTLLNELDKNLEKFLSSAKATTVKFVAPIREKQVAKQEELSVVSEPVHDRNFQFAASRYSTEQLKEAKTRRDAEVRQLEARLGRLENFSKAGDNVAFNIPLQLPASPTKIPVPLRSLREVALIVPEVYPLEPCTVVLRGVDGDEAENVEDGFEKLSVSHPHLSLMARVNYLTQNLGKLAIDTRPPSETVNITEQERNETIDAALQLSKIKNGAVRDPDRPHLHYVARPPEWDLNHDQDSADATESSDYDSDEDDEEEDQDSELEGAAGGAHISTVTGIGLEKGIAILFPGLEMEGIELLEMTGLSFTMKCERCKQSADIKDIKPSKSDGTSNVHRSETCTKCTMPFRVTYRPELIHANSHRAGHIDLENSTIIALLPSMFRPTCGSCSTPFPTPPGITTIPGDTAMAVCRNCHAKMHLHIAEVKFLRVSIATSTTALPLRKHRSKDPLRGTLTANTPLPFFGKCIHYSRSYRWFRFTCCNAVFPCDRCHQQSPAQKTDPHPNEHADRMICGWCSREQRYHPDTCRFCRLSVVKMRSTGSGFWEGGKGTREKHLMRRKEGRKFKRAPGEKKDDEERRRKRKEGKGRGGMWWPG